MFTRSQRTLAQGLMLVMGTILVVIGSGLYFLDVLSELAALDKGVHRKARIIAASIRYPSSLSLEGQFQVPSSSEILLRNGENRQTLEDLEIDLDYVPRLGSKAPLLESDLVYIRWYDAEGKLQRFSGVPPSAVEPLDLTELGFVSRSLGEATTSLWVRQLLLPLVYQEQTLGYLQVAVPLAPVAQSLDQSRLGFSIALPLGVGFIGLVSWGFGALAMQPLRRSHQSLEQFTSDASHELRSPIAAILNNAEVGLMATEPQEQRLRLERIVTLSQSLASLLNSLFLLARTQGPDLLPWRQSVNLTHLVNCLTGEYGHSAIATGLTWEAILPVQSYIVMGHGELLALALGNLFSNACRYTPTGGTVTITLSTQPHQAIVTVTDTGIGIAPEDLPHICDRFYRTSQTRSRQDGGFGLGLAIAQHIITAHDGTLQIESEVGIGSTFRVTLPLA
ncbi:sensor histidine kinase [Leptolyngbya sp. PCC 6406]|uniref:sensor histidine kinase n=1 Tax=Leptolyngbya sp. PCC 6406 TaxID=1173264 RepID=UPI0002AC9BE5|nr:HAMP domain-containing sensor histidine kinase [Leptolyngbya sp. PCC 6406]